MKLSKYKEDYQWFSEKTSDVARQLSFAGIAVVWIFRIQSASGSKIPRELLLPLSGFCVSLTFDLLHYFLGYVIWSIFYRYNEKKRQSPADDPDLTHSAIWPNILHICFLGKILALFFSYFMMLKYAWDIWFN